MAEREYKERVFVVVYADLVFGENPREAFDNMNEGVNNVRLPVSEMMDLGDSKDYPILSSDAQIDEAVREKLDEFMQEFSQWAQGQTKEKKATETKIDALHALKIDMVSVEKRLEQFGADECLKEVASVVSSFIEDLQVRAEREPPLDLSLSRETIIKRREALISVRNAIFDKQELIDEVLEDEDDEYRRIELESKKGGLDWVDYKIDEIENTLSVTSKKEEEIFLLLSPVRKREQLKSWEK